MTRTSKIIAVALSVTVLGGCFSSGAPTETVTVTVTPSPTRVTSKPPVEVGDVTVPNVVGMVHQAAQDKMQSVGLRNLAEEDATGQKRLLLNDRNWVVVSQDPAAGTVVPKTAKILLRSKKQGEN